MRSWLRQRAVWQVVLGFGVAMGLPVLARAADVSQTAGTILVLLLVAGFVAVIAARADGSGWGICVLLVAVGFVLKSVHWPAFVELLAFVAVSTTLARVLLEPPDPRSA